MAKKVPKNDIIINGINIDEWLDESQSIELNPIKEVVNYTEYIYEKVQW